MERETGFEPATFSWEAVGKLGQGGTPVDIWDTLHANKS